MTEEQLLNLEDKYKDEFVNAIAKEVIFQLSENYPEEDLQTLDEEDIEVIAERVTDSEVLWEVINEKINEAIDEVLLEKNN